MKRHWTVGLILFAAILALHITIGSKRTADPAKISYWVENVGGSFDLAVTRTMIPEQPVQRGPASVAEMPSR